MKLLVLIHLFGSLSVDLLGIMARVLLGIYTGMGVIE